MRVIVFLTALFFAYSALATLTVTEVSGASRYIVDTVNSVSYVYGGMAGGESTGGCASKDNLNTCNNCAADIQPCNNTRIYPALHLRITVQTTAADVSGKKVLMKNKNGTTSALTPVTTVYMGGAGSAATYEVTWQNVCAAGVTTGTNTDCSTAFSQDFLIGIDKAVTGDIATEESVTLKIVVASVATDTNGTNLFHDDCFTDGTGTAGFCDFAVGAGDSKVYVKDTQTASYPTSINTNVDFDHLRFYYVEGPDLDETTCDSQQGLTSTFANINYASDYIERATTASDGSGVISDRKLTGLENDKTYYFRMANVDVTGNIYLASPNGETVGSNTYHPFLNGCRHAAKPGEVVGLLQEQSCFIATAAYGSGMAPQVEKFRAFRNRYLLTNWVGRKLVKAYYATSPPFAKFIAEHEALRTMARMALWPVLMMVDVFLWNFWIGLLILLSLVFLLASVSLQRTQKVDL